MSGNFKVLSLCVERDQSLVPHTGATQNQNHQQLPHASVYVLDGSSLSYGAESLIERIRAMYPRARLLLIKESSKDSEVFPYLRLGIRGIVRYADAENDLVSAVNIVAKDDVWVHRKQLVRFIDWVLTTPTYRSTLSGPGSLSRREREVLVSILDGLTNKEIASVLNISERTVKFHVSHLLQKYGVQRRADLILKQYKLWPSLT
jgi:DNA-binding NarL/FixJ family response regulator